MSTVYKMLRGISILITSMLSTSHSGLYSPYHINLVQSWHRYIEFCTNMSVEQCMIINLHYCIFFSIFQLAKTISLKNRKTVANCQASVDRLLTDKWPSVNGPLLTNKQLTDNQEYFEKCCSLSKTFCQTDHNLIVMPGLLVIKIFSSSMFSSTSIHTCNLCTLHVYSTTIQSSASQLYMYHIHVQYLYLGACWINGTICGSSCCFCFIHL